MRIYTSLALCTLVVNWTLTLIASIAVVVVYCHRLPAGGLFVSVRPDDILLLISFIIGLVLVSLSTWGILDEGQAEHQQNVSDSHLERAAKSLLVAEALWTMVTGLLRIAACLMAYRIFSVSKFARRTTSTIIAMSAGLAAASSIQIFLICKPFAAQWDPRVLGACGDQVASFMALEAAGLVLDLGILMVPTVMISGLQMPLEKRIQLAFVFNIGAVVLVVTGLRMASLQKAVSPDFTYSQSYLSLLSASGCMAGIICCASPSLWGSLKRMFVRRRRRCCGGIMDIMGPSTMRNRATGTFQNIDEGSTSRTGEDRTEGWPVHASDTARYNQGPDRPPGDGADEGAMSQTDRDRGRRWSIASQEARQPHRPQTYIAVGNPQRPPRPPLNPTAPHSLRHAPAVASDSECPGGQLVYIYGRWDVVQVGPSWRTS
ncbi:hypothetical protein KVR01_006375 [Diaporthe batatas]|uniref:uncharacterized protein n=1 Tax=Diaporthe batatas TaxID=748121 RepID=UPI001D059966|nr:uncharacterized protein KVR01_006375 [Diaporthe batatas]KAG8164457.1 hypothetical protein KVR01_006375 [Diaporthe batatas]